MVVNWFDPSWPLVLRCLSVLAGLEAGRILTDDIQRPTWVAVWEADDGTVFFGGAVDADIVTRVIEELRREMDVLVAFPDSDVLAELLPQPDDQGYDLEFRDYIPYAETLAVLQQPLPDGYTLVPLNADLLPRTAWYESKVRRYGSVPACLTGVVVLHGEQIACEAYADASALGYRELGVVSHRDYRRQGLAMRACAALVQASVQAGERLCWNCASDNVESAALARKLGFRGEERYPVWVWTRRGA